MWYNYATRYYSEVPMNIETLLGYGMDVCVPITGTSTAHPSIPAHEKLGKHELY